MTDALGSVIQRTVDGVVVAEKRYDAFGNVVDEVAGVGQPLVDYAYRSRELDAQTGLYYNRARYYDPSTGRFVTRDPAYLSLVESEWPALGHQYAYGVNNPLTWDDPLGLYVGCVGIGATIDAGFYGGLFIGGETMICHDQLGNVGLVTCLAGGAKVVKGGSAVVGAVTLNAIVDNICKLDDSNIAFAIGGGGIKGGAGFAGGVAGTKNSVGVIIGVGVGASGSLPGFVTAGPAICVVTPLWGPKARGGGCSCDP